jgi:hypothetical protein
MQPRGDDPPLRPPGAGRRSLARVAAAALAGCLALAGSGCTKDQPPQPAGRLGSAEPAARAPATTATPSRPEPVLRLPAGLKLVFEPEQTGDPVKDAILADNEHLIKAFYQAVDRGNPADPVFGRYATGTAAAVWGRWVAEFKQGGWTATGTDRYFDRVVQLEGPGRAGVSFCQDQRFVYSKVKSTGQVLRTRPSANSFVLYQAVVEKSRSGIWQTTNTISQRGAQRCR